MNLELALFDIEGTLTGRNGRGFAPELPGRLQDLMGAGVKVGLVTGREGSYARAVANLFELNGPIIVENGSALAVRDEEISLGGLDSQIKDKIVNHLRKKGVLKRMRLDHDKKWMITLYPKGFPLDYDPEDLPGYYQTVRGFLRGYSGLDITHSSAAVDITVNRVNKGKAIRRYCAANDFELENVAFAGDSMNDLPAFRVVGEAGGYLGLISDSGKLRRLLRGYKCCNPIPVASNGTRVFIDYLLAQ